MKLLLDQDVYGITARFLVEEGHDVLRVKEIGFERATDEANLAKAIELDRIFVTRDRDYGNLVFVRQIRGGVIYLRILPTNAQAVHEELSRVLNHYSVQDLRNAFIVVEKGRHRFRRI